MILPTNAPCFVFLAEAQAEVEAELELELETEVLCCDGVNAPTAVEEAEEVACFIFFCATLEVTSVCLFLQLE